MGVGDIEKNRTRVVVSFQGTVVSPGKKKGQQGNGCSPSHSVIREMHAHAIYVLLLMGPVPPLQLPCRKPGGVTRREEAAVVRQAFAGLFDDGCEWMVDGGDERSKASPGGNLSLHFVQRV